jgi:hypothetical protein
MKYQSGVSVDREGVGKRAEESESRFNSGRIRGRANVGDGVPERTPP